MRAALVAAGLVTIPSIAAAQDSAAGTLTVTATIESSIGLKFENESRGCWLNRSRNQRCHHGARRDFRLQHDRRAWGDPDRLGVRFHRQLAVRRQGRQGEHVQCQLLAGRSPGRRGQHQQLAHQLDRAHDVKSESGCFVRLRIAGGAHDVPAVPFSASTGAISKVLNFTATAN